MKSTFSRTLLLMVFGCLVASTAFAKSMELTSANTYFKQGDMRQALEWYEKADQKDTREGDVYAHLVELYADAKRWGDMNAAYVKLENCKDKERKLTKFKKHAKDIIDSLWMGLWNGSLEQFNTAKELATAGDQSGAAASFEECRSRLSLALEILPARPDFLRRMGDVYITEYNSLYKNDEGQPLLTKAADFYGQLLVVSPDSLAYAVTWTTLLFNSRDFDGTWSAVNSLLNRFPGDPDLLNYGAKARIQQGLALGGDEGKAMMQEATELLHRALESDPENASMHYNLALLYSDMEAYSDALLSYKHVIELAPDDKSLCFDSWYSMAVIYLQSLPEEQLDAKQSALCFEEAVNLQPDNAQLKQNWGVALVRSGDPDMIKQGLELMGN
jgi:tetratricopeptide (TPR) repeat protein